MATLAVIRAALNLELGVDVADDATDVVFTQAARNAAIAAAYAGLWLDGIRKDAVQNITTVADTWTYALTSIRQLARIELLDSLNRILERPHGIVEQSFAGTNAYQLTLTASVAAGYTLRVRGYAPYISVFANDAAVDDLPLEYERIPVLKAKIILYETQRALFMRYGEKQALPESMNVSLEALIGMIRECWGEYRQAARSLSGARQRSGQTARF